MKKIIEKRADGSIRVKLITEGESKTRQEMKNQTDINVLMKKYGQTGQIHHLAKGIPFYGDVTNITDYKSALDAVNSANDAFKSLPSELRNRFSNDPTNLIDFLNNPSNLEEAQKLGLVKRPTPVVPEEIPIKIDPKP